MKKFILFLQTLELNHFIFFSEIAHLEDIFILKGSLYLMEIEKVLNKCKDNLEFHSQRQTVLKIVTHVNLINGHWAGII